MGKLSTHVLDTMNGCPAQHVNIDLYRHENGTRSLIKSVKTNADGRCGEPLLQDQEVAKGQYELVFHAGDYFAARGVALPSPRFVDQVSIHFGIAEEGGSYHVPLVVTPWSWSTYRGS
jgi:5-hydroxyisourate hydrolase